jgi:DNA-binding MarR family transcriptional regulator
MAVEIVRDTVRLVRSDNERAAAALRRGTTRLGRRLRAERPPGALSANKVSVLGHLHRSGAATPGEIAAADGQRPQSLTRVFAELELAGLITRAPSEVDGRAAVLDLTEAGRAAVRADMAGRDAWLAAAMEQLTGTEVEVLRLAGALMDRLAGIHAAAGERAGAA